MESRVIEPRNGEVSAGLHCRGCEGETRGPLECEVQRRGRGRRAGQTIRRETMKHGIPVPHQRKNTGLGRNRKSTSSAPSSRLATDGANENQANTSGLRGEIDSSQSGWAGSLSNCIVPIEPRGTEKRRDPVSREGGCPKTGTDARRHELPH